MSKRWDIAVLVGLMLAAPAGAVEPSPADPWQPVRMLAGEWVGSAEGQVGKGTVRRKYVFVLKDKFLYETNISTYPPQEKNRDGEVHEHWSMISYDRIRKTLVLRQFHQEGFVNQYVLNAAASGPRKLVFDSERFENLKPEWKARETYEFLSIDEYTETFEVAEPGKQLELYSRNHFKRYKGEHCSDNTALRELKQQYGLLVLCAATDVLAGADSACAAALGDDWKTWRPRELKASTPPAKVDMALEWVCASVLSLPTGPDSVVTRRLEAWCAVYNVVERYGNSEALATAAYRVPTLADLFPGAKSRAPDGDIGESLSSSEHVELLYKLASRISSLPEQEMTSTLLRLSDEFAKETRRAR